MPDNTKDADRLEPLAFKANGAALTLSLVAAGNLLQNETLIHFPIVPSWLFFFGLISAYICFALVGVQDTHFKNLNTIQTIRKTIFDIENEETPSEVSLRIKADSEKNIEIAQRRLLTDQQIQANIRIMNWAFNASLACFATGVFVALSWLTWFAA